jgi:putative ABC transport system permease protein
MIPKIAFKNIWRNKERSLIVITAITLALTGGIFTASIMTGMVDQKFRSGINNEVSHIQIHNPDFLKNLEPQYSIPSADSIANIISRMPDVRSVSERTRVPGMISSPNAATGIQIMGIDPEKEKKVTQIYKTVCDSCGGYFTGSRKNPILVSKRLADKLKVRLKSKVVIRFQNTDGNISEAAFTITGIYHTANNGFDDMNAFVRSEDFDKISGNMIKPHEIAILLSDFDKIADVQTALKQRFPGLDVENWEEISPEMGLITSAISLEIYIILGIILLALAFGIVNTMLMIVFERTRELGMLMAVGMSKARVFRMIMLETILLTFIGGIIGMVVSAFLVSLFHKHGIDLSAVSKGLGAFGFDPKIYPFITTAFYFNLSIMILATGILSAIVPARKALKLKPVEAIRIE